jgi:hypothetical protein
MSARSGRSRTAGLEERKICQANQFIANLRQGLSSQTHCCKVQRMRTHARICCKVRINSAGFLALIRDLASFDQRCRLRIASKVIATITLAIMGSADRLTAFQPAPVRISPAKKDDTAIMAKIRKSFAPCTFARSSGW